MGTLEAEKKTIQRLLISKYNPEPRRAASQAHHTGPGAHGRPQDFRAGAPESLCSVMKDKNYGVSSVSGQVFSTAAS